jgi:hypothetical protein
LGGRRGGKLLMEFVSIARCTGKGMAGLWEPVSAFFATLLWLFQGDG